jgi:anti-sigma B factor antagonist
MRVSTVVREEFAILRFEVQQILGEEAQEFQDTILTSLEKNIKFIIVDLSEVKFISSWGIGILIHGLTTTKNRGGEFRVTGLSENVQEIFKKVRLDTVFNIYNTVDKAMSKN